MQLQQNRYFFSVSAEGLSQDFAFDAFLFVQEKHLKTQSDDDLLFFQLSDRKTNRIAVHLPVFLDQHGLAYSPGKAPFGSVQCKHQLPEEVLAEFLEHTKRYLLEHKNCHTIRIKSYPFAYAPSESTLLTNLLLEKDFKITHSEINQHLPVSENLFETVLHPSAKRRLQKCRKHGFIFQEEPVEVLSEIWQFIHTCRLERNYEPPLPLEKLKQLFMQFPAEFRLFSVRQNQELAAATITVQINGEILYNFYPAHLIRYNAFSPVVFLTEGLYRFCQQQKMKILDLGTSHLPSGPNYPLIAFKKHLGGEPTLKLTFEFKA